MSGTLGIQLVASSREKWVALVLRMLMEIINIVVMLWFRMIKLPMTQYDK